MTSHPGARLTQPKHVRTHRGSECAVARGQQAPPKANTFRYRGRMPTPPPPPRPCPLGPLSYQGSIATGHKHGGTEGARKFFSDPLPMWHPSLPMRWSMDGRQREGRGEATTSDFVPLFGDPRDCRGYVALPPTCGPPRRQG